MDTILRDATVTNWPYIDALRKKEWNALGFIPEACYLSVLERQPVDGRRRWEYSRILVTEDNDELTGFAYASFANGMARVFQIAVQEGARRFYRASLMIGEIEREAQYRQCLGIKVRVAVDLDSNEFWKALGYEPIEIVPSSWKGRASVKGRLLIVYMKHFAPLFVFDRIAGIG